LNKFTAI